MVIANFTEEVFETKSTHAAEVARHQELLEERPRLADDRLEPIDECQSKQHEMKVGFCAVFPP